MTLHKLDKSWLATWTFSLLLILGFIGFLVYSNLPTTVKANTTNTFDAGPTFRIVEVRAEEGQLALEVQHFKPDGTHWFYEMYSWEGSAEYVRDRVKNNAGHFLLEDGSVAPFKPGAEHGLKDQFGVEFFTNPPTQYLPSILIQFEERIIHLVSGLEKPKDQCLFSDPCDNDFIVTNISSDTNGAFIGVNIGDTISQVLGIQGAPDVITEDGLEYTYYPVKWMEENVSSLKEAALLDTITSTHVKRFLTGWNNNRGRLVLPSTPHDSEDIIGSNILQTRFEHLVGNVYTIDSSMNTYLYEGLIDPALVDEVAERVDLRTANSKTYQIGEDEFRSVHQSGIHYKDTLGNWVETNLEFRPVEGGFVMDTHPEYSVFGATQHISMITPEGDVGARWYTPTPITYEKTKAYYIYDGLKWEYILTNAGLKLVSEVVEPKGLKEYEFVFLALGETGNLSIDDSGNATTNQFQAGALDPGGVYFDYWFDEAFLESINPVRVVVPRSKIIGADEVTYDGGSWEIVDDYRIKFSFDDSILPDEAYPYIIDPTTTFNVASGTDDGHLTASSGSYPPTYSSMDFTGTSFRVKNSSGYTLEDAYIRFDTSSLPNDVLVISAQLKLACHSYSAHAADNAMLHAAWVQGASWPITSSHLYRSSGSAYGADQPVPTNAMEEYPLKGACGGPLNQGNHNAYTTYELQDPQSNVQATSWPPGQRHILPTGYSGLRLGIRMDVGSGSNAFDYSHQFAHENVAPTGTNEMTFHSGEHASELTPQLVVTYTHARIHVCPSTTVTYYTNTTNAQSGRVYHIQASPGQTWEYIRMNTVSGELGLGNPVSPMRINVAEYWGHASWATISRGIVSFDTASLPDDAVITHGYVSLTGAENNVMGLRADWDNRVFLTDAYPANPALVANTDYSKVGYMPQAILIDYDIDHDGVDSNSTAEQWSSSESITKHNFFLTAIGRGYIKADGVTSFGLRLAADLFDEEPIKIDHYTNTAIFYQQVAVSPGQNPALHLTYQVPCSEIDSTSTVSNTTVSTFYSSNLDGRVNRYNAANVSWQAIRELAGTSLNAGAHSESYGGANPDTRASGTYYSNFWSSVYRTFFNFDTTGLPDYACTTGSSTFSTSTSYPATDGIIQYGVGSAGDDWEVIHARSSGNYIEESGGHIEAKVRSSSTSNKYNMIIRAWMYFDVGSTIPDDAIITYAKLGVVVTNNGAYSDWPTSGSGAWTYPAASLVSHIPTSATGHVANDFRGENESGNRGFGQLKLAEDRQVDTVISGMTSKYAEDGSTRTWTQLNTRGLNLIDAAKTSGTFPDDGVARFGMRLDWDAQGYRQAQSMSPFPDSGPSTSKEVYAKFSSAEGGASNAPQLYVEWTVPCSIHSAFVRFSGGKGNSNATKGEDRSFALTTSGIASDTGLAMTDFQDSLGYNTELSDRFPTSSWTDCFDSGASWAWEGAVEDCTAEDGLPYNYNYFGLNDRGKVYINDTGSTNFMLRHEWDMDGIGNVNPGAGRGPNRGITSADGINGSFYEAGANVRPELVVVHGSLTPVSIGDALLFQSSGQTLIINVNGANFLNPLSTANKQAIIDGITGSLGAGSSNWNEAVRDIQTTAVVTGPTNYNRTVTVTFEAAPLFNPSASIETISIAIPASVITTNSELISLPGSTFQIDQIPFGLTSISPTMTSNAGTLLLTVNGLGLPGPSFSGSEAITLIKSGQPNIDCTGSSGGGTSVIASCALGAGVAVGAWDVKAVDAAGLNDTLPAALTLYEPWSSTVNGGSFSESGSDYAVFAHTDLPYFTVQAFDEVDKEWDSSSSPPATIPAAAGTDAMFTSDKTRLVVGTAANANYLWAYVFDPATGVISGTPPNPTSVGSIGVNDFDIGTGDNIVVAATTDSAGVYMYDIDNAGAIAGFWTSTLSAPSSPPGAECTAVDINANATYVAVGCTTTPYLHVWAITNGGTGTPAWGTKVATVSDLPDGAINGVKFSPDGTQIAIAIDTSPYVEVYEFNGGTVGDKASPPGDLPDGIGYDVAWLNYNVTGLTNLAVAHAITPFVSIYPFTTDAAAPGTFGTKLGDPSTPPTGTASSVGFHPNDDTVFVGHASSPFVTAYNFTGVNDDDYRVYRYMANFDTSYLPDDASISAATLSLYGDSVNGSGWQLLFEDGASASEPLVVGDYDFNNYSTQLTASGLTPTTGWNEVTLNAAGLLAISKTGVTQILIRHEDDIGNSAPAAVETMDIEVGDSGTFPESCLVSNPIALRSNSLYNLCNSPNVPVLRITYTSASAGPLASDADLSVVLTDADSPNADGTYNTQVFAKGPIVYLEVSTSPSTATYEFALNRVIADSANDWTFLDSTTGAPFPFMKNFKAYSDDGVTQTLWYELDSEPRAQMEDRAGSNDSSYMSLPNDSTTVTSTVGTPGDVGGISVSIGEGAGVPSIADDSADSSDIVISGTSDTSNEGLPMAGFFDYVEEAGGMPSGILKLMFAMVVTILAGLIAFKSFQSVAATYIAMLMAIVAFTLGMNGIFEWWMLLTFGLTGGIFIFTRRAYV